CAIVRVTLILSLFPYTTLFRSAGLQYRCIRVGSDRVPLDPDVRGRRGPLGGCNRDNRPAQGRELAHRPPAFVLAPGNARAGAVRDRKSTRLNSSHVKISYAVFC